MSVCTVLLPLGGYQLQLTNISYLIYQIPYHICADVDNTPSALYKIHHYEQLPVVSHVFFIP